MGIAALYPGYVTDLLWGLTHRPKSMKPRQDVITKICQFFFVELHSVEFLLVDLFERNRLTLEPASIFSESLQGCKLR
ncbi:hypothetical protein CSC73_17890 [Pseudoxanthomonas sacheonensis]|nr:hypothetical protein CSC73_17890 [Pseudoxanthomonas sacheonensis]